MLLHKGLAEIVGGFRQEMPPQVIAPDGQRLGGDQAAEGLERLRLANQQRGFTAWKAAWNRDHGEIAVPIDAGSQLRQLAPLELVVVLLGIAQFHQRARGFCQLGLEGHNRVGGSLGRCGGIARQFEHFRDMLHVGGADFLGVLSLAKVVVALRQPETALAEAGDHGGGVLVVDLHVEVETDVESLALHVGDDRNQVLTAGDYQDVAIPGSQRLQCFAFDRRLVHAGSIEIADALRHASFGRPACADSSRIVFRTAKLRSSIS